MGNKKELNKEELNIEELSLEEAFSKIDELTDDMQRDEASLEESFENYKLGMKLIKHCGDKIARVESQLKTLNSSDESID